MRCEDGSSRVAPRTSRSGSLPPSASSARSVASVSAVVRVTVLPRRATAVTAGSPSSRGRRSAVKAMVRPATPALTCAADPSATIRPPAITTTRSATASASSRWWVAKTTVCPRAAGRASSSRRRGVLRRPSPTSARRGAAAAARPASARARRTRWRWPPERASTAAEQTVDAGGGDQVVQRPGRGKLRRTRAQHLADTAPRWAGRRAGASRRRSRPGPPRPGAGRARCTAPAAGCSRPRTALTMVDLPAPLGPSRATVWPVGMVEVQVVDGERVAVADGQSGDVESEGGGHAISVARPPRRQ